MPLVTNESGKTVWSTDYTPFGQVTFEEGLMGSRPNKFAKFTGKDLDEDTGLYYFNARWYDQEIGRFISEDPAKDGLNWYTYAGNNPLNRMDPTGLWYYDLDEETGDWFAVAEKGDTIWGLSEEVYGTSEYAARLQKDNEIARAESLQAGQRLQLGTYNDAAKKLHGQFLKHGYMFGEVSFETILAHGFLPWELMDQDERAFMKDYYIALELLYQSGTITKEQYEKESSRIESKDGRPDKGYWYESAQGNITATYDEAYLAAGLAAIRTVQIFGPVVASRPFFQKLGSDIPDVKYSTTSKRYVMEVCNGVIRYRDTVTGRFVMDPFKHVHTSLSDPRLWSDMVSRMNEINKTLKSSREAQTLFEALEAYLKHKVIK